MGGYARTREPAATRGEDVALSGQASSGVFYDISTARTHLPAP
jgi:hypothetical protein